MRQRYRKMTSLAALAAMAVLAATACQATAQGARKSAYDTSIDTDRLVQTLDSLGMTELQDELYRELQAAGGGGAEMLMGAARRKIAAAKAQHTPLRRNALLDEAVAILRKAVAKYTSDAKAASDETARARTTIKRWRAELLMAVTDALTRGEPYANKLLFLQGAQADRKALAAATATAAIGVRDLTTEIEDMIPEWRGNMRIWIVVAGEVKGLFNETKYRAAWIRLYHGMAAAKQADLRAARNLGEEFLSPRFNAAIRNPALLLVARALREAGEHAGAARMLTRLLAARVDASGKINAHFEHVRNLIEHGRALARSGKGGDEKYTAVPQALNAFRTQGHAVAKKDEDMHRRVDLLATLAEHYFHETRAATERKRAPAKAAEYDKKAQQALLGFLKKYNEEVVQNAFYEIIYRKYRDRKDYKKLSSVVLLAVASHEFGLGEQQKGKGGEAPALDKAQKILAEVCSRTDEVTKTHVRPLALWMLAFVYNYKNDSFKSAENFALLAKEYPDHEKAYKAATNARKTIDYYYKRAERKADNLRALYIQVFKIYCEGEKWRDKPEVLPWNFQFAEAYEYFCKKAKGAAEHAVAQASNAARDLAQAKGRLDEAKDAKAKAVVQREVTAMEGKLAPLAAKAASLRKGAITMCINVAGIYERVPESEKTHMEHMQARQRALQYRTFALELLPRDGQGDDIKLKGAAMILARQQEEYSDAALRAVPDVEKSDKAASVHLKNWGADALFLAAKLWLDYGDGKQDDKAMRALDTLREKWSDTLAFSKSEDLRIRRLVYSGQIDKAIAALFAFLDRYPDLGEVLLRMVITQIQQRIDRLEGLPGEDNEDKYKKYVADYVKLAEKLHDRVKDKPLSDPQCYAITQTVADAMMKNGQHAQSLDLFKQCKKQEDERNTTQRAKITAEFKPMQKALADASSHAALLARMNALNDFMKLRQVSAEQSRDLASSTADAKLQMVLLKAEEQKRKEGGSSDAKVKGRVDDARKVIGHWLDDVEKILKARVEVSALNVLGIARANEGLGANAQDPAEAKKYYTQAVTGFEELARTNFDMNIPYQARMKWLGELGYCRSLLAVEPNRETAKAVLRRIKQARHNDTQPGGALPMGGYADRFLMIEAKAKALLRN